MWINDDIWEIIKSYLFDKKDIIYRITVNRMKNRIVVNKEKEKMERFLLLERIREEY